jgi:hypothetical protein
MSKPTSIGKKVQSRIKASVLRTEGAVLDPDRRGPGRTAHWNPGVLEAIVTTAITAASGTTYGKGNATIQIDSLSGVTYTAGANSAYATGILILNWLQNTGTIAIGTHITVYWANGNYRLLTADC